MAEQKSTQIQTDPEVRDRIGEAVMTSIICTHEFDSAVCETCWESTQRIGAALVAALPVSRIVPTRKTDQSDEARRLLSLALHLRMYGECASGGHETWAQFDTDLEHHLRDLPRPKPLAHKCRREHGDVGGF